MSASAGMHGAVVPEEGAAAGQSLILAPRGRDAAVIEQVLTRTGLRCAVCAAMPALLDLLGDSVESLVVTEEALACAALPQLLRWIDDQPPWSDLPVIVLATKQAGRRRQDAADLLDRLGNVVLLERPINAETLSSAVATARRARLRQYQARALLQAQTVAANALRRLNETLEQRVEERARELDQTRETLAFALDAAGMGSWDMDLRQDQARCSPQHDRIFGYAVPPPSWGRERFLSHVVADDRMAVAAAFDSAVRRGSLDVECRIDRADGARRWIATRGRVVFDSAGAPVRMAGVVMDMTDRRATEDALHQAQKMEAIGQLTGGVAHDFNNLLTVIVGGLDMMMRRPEQTERVTRLARAAMSAARRGEQLTQQLLAFSRRQMLRPETLDPNQLLLAFEPLAQRAIGETVTLSLALDPAAGPVRVDPAQCEAALLNLIVNARDAMPGGGTITVRTRETATPVARCPELAPGAYVCIEVADTGTGIDQATLARAFEPFFTTKEVGRGSGLGLSQVYGFVRSAGGGVAIDSVLGAGTTVALYLPRSDEAPAEARTAGSEVGSLRRADSGETVLLVEDDEQVLGMAVDSLEELHYKVLVARNAREALAFLGRPDRIDVMFSDVVMPGGMNGAQLAAVARQMRPALKILLTSGYVGAPGGQDIAQDLPVLTKPYRRDELARQLRVVLADASPQPELRAIP
jgi:signal transduction histidine kinase/response regulator RpfG family c-di-GMP phosphodiesterase